MIKKMMIAGLIAVFTFPVIRCFADVSINTPAPDFTLNDSNGLTHSLTEYKGKYVVVEWVNYECPFVIKHYGSGNMQKLQNELTAKDVIWLSINSSAEGNQGYFPTEKINALMEERGAKSTAYLLDTDGTVGKMYGAKTTPHMFIVNPDGNLIYKGAIDDIASFDPADIPNAQNYVLAALSAAMAGNDVAVPSTKSYGCSVKY